MIITVVVAIFAGPQALDKLSRLFSCARKAFDKAIATLSYWMTNIIDYMIYNLRGNSGGRAGIKIATADIAGDIVGLINFSSGTIIAKVLDRFDKDGKSGVIVY